jgi:hypothetical protein
MSLIQESKNLGDLLKYEAPNLYSRDQVIVASGQNLALGAVVGRVTTTGKLKVLAPAATDGTEAAVGILAGDINASTGDRDDGVLIARHALVASHALVWPAGITSAQKTTAIAQLEARGVLIRTAA